MKKKILPLCLIFLVLYQAAFTQACPPNLDFETGSFDNWQCFVGSTSAIGAQNNILLVPSAPVTGRHEIISGAGSAKDMYGLFPQLCPYGGKYSIKLGNANTGAEAEGISYTFQVPSSVDTFSFTYFYAVVFQDPNHLAIEQPRFFVTAYDVATGDLINCASYDYISTGGIPGFKVSTVRSDVLYKEWSPVSIQFAGLANKTVRLEFKTADCTRGGHFGYTYVDVGSGCSNILASAPFCIETNSVVLNAPYGFQSYTWYNEDYSAVIGNQQSVTLSPPPATFGTFHVDIVPYPGYGCKDTAHAVVTPLPVPDTPAGVADYYFCQFERAYPLSATSQQGSDLLWYTSATGGIGNPSAPTPSTSTAGVFEFYVSQKVLFGCESFRKKLTVTVIATPVASFTIDDDKQCEKGNRFVFTSISSNLDKSKYIWTFGDGQTFTSSDSITAYSYPRYGTFNVKLRVENPPACFTEKTGTAVVIPNPIAAFTYPPLICEKETLLSLKDNSSVPANLDRISAWWWSIDGNVSSSQNPVPFIANNPGNLRVGLMVTSVQGCTSDTNFSNLAVRYRPDAAFKYSTPLCDNGIIQFTNLSALPQTAVTEFPAKWLWQFDSSTSTLREPLMLLTSGGQHVRLTAESNYGCKSLAADSLLVVYPKPEIQLQINDSCIKRSISYSAIDNLNTVSKWYWNFGNGLREGASVVTRYYSAEGYRPLTLMAETIYGCRDTIIRPFTIYDNKALAGNDTIAAIDQPVQLNAHGGSDVRYTWSPSTGLNNPAIENPVALWDKDQLYQLDALTKEGCDSHSRIFIKRYKGPEIYIPTAFSPNGDGRNDVLNVFPIGIKTFHFLSVYDRWGELVYRTTDHLKGWDGTYKGKMMNPGTFIAVAQAIDYTGKKMFRKSAVILVK